MNSTLVFAGAAVGSALLGLAVGCFLSAVIDRWDGRAREAPPETSERDSRYGW